MLQTHAHSHPPPRYDRSCSTNASMAGMRERNHALRHLQKQQLINTHVHCDLQ